MLIGQHGEACRRSVRGMLPMVTYDDAGSLSKSRLRGSHVAPRCLLSGGRNESFTFEMRMKILSHCCAFRSPSKDLGEKDLHCQ